MGHQPLWQVLICVCPRDPLLDVPSPTCVAAQSQVMWIHVSPSRQTPTSNVDIVDQTLWGRVQKAGVSPSNASADGYLRGEGVSP